MAGRLKTWCEGWGTAMLAGALFVVFVGRMSGETTRAAVPLLGLVGAVYGLAVLGLIRLFGTRSFGYPVAGLLAGPLPAALMIGARAAEGDRAGVLLAGSLLGLFVGLLEWARRRPAPPTDSL